MLKLILWCKIIHSYSIFLPRLKIINYLHFFRYFKILNDKNYKILKKRYPFYYDKFFTKFGIEINIIDKNIPDEKKINIIEDVIKNKYFNSEPFYFIFLYNYFRLFDSFIVANYLFEQINKNFINLYSNRKLKKRYLIYILNSSIYLQNLDLFREIIKNYNYKFIENYKNLYNIISKQRLVSKNQKNKNKSKKYSNYIYNKIVSIIGPSYNNLVSTYKETVNSVYVFTTHREYSNISHHEKVLYLNSYKINNLLQEIKEKRENFKFFNLKNIIDYKNLKKNNFKNIRAINMPNLFFNNGFPMMMQCLVYDLIHFLPKKILLTGIDFYLFASPGNFKYKDYDTSLDEISKSIREHDIFENKKFLEFILLSNLVEVDEKINNILKIDDYNFSKILNFHYKNYKL